MKLLSKKLPDGKKRTLVNDTGGITWIASSNPKEVSFAIGLSNTVKNYQLQLDENDIINLRQEISEFENAMGWNQ